MAEKKIIVDYYFDYCCPWTYLSFKRLIQTTTRTASAINWKPVLIADIEAEIGPKIDSRTLYSSEINYENKDLQDWANYCGLKIVPRNDDSKKTSIKALCGALFALEANKIDAYSGLVFDAYFADLKDIANNDILTEIATNLELDLKGFQSAIDSIQSVEQLKKMLQNWWKGVDLDHQPCLWEMTCILVTTECRLLNFPLVEQLARFWCCPANMAHKGMNMLDY